MIVVLDPSIPFSSQVVASDTTYIIRDSFVVGGTLSNPLELQDHCILRFEGGRLQNGVIRGAESSIQNPTGDVVFENVLLVSNFSGSNCLGWIGMCYDTWFLFEEGLSNSHKHSLIVKSVCQFEKCFFSDRTYYLSLWEKILLRPSGCTIRGDETVIVLPSDKGSLKPGGGWGGFPQYSISSLFEKVSPDNTLSAGIFSVSNLTILDNSLLLPSGWGENITHFTFYSVFMGSGNRTILKNVRYDGGGCLWKDYNTSVAIKDVLIEDCEVKSSQFAVELGNAGCIDGSYPGGSCQSVRIRDCRFYNYEANVLVGQISIVPSDKQTESCITKELVIENTFFDSQVDANIETTGAEKIIIRNNVFLSTFCSSELGYYKKYDENNNCIGDFPINKKTLVVGNVFDISDNLLSAGRGLRVCSGDLDFINNTVIVDFSRISSGSFFIRGYGEPNIANITNNTFVIKRSDLPVFKFLIASNSMNLNLIGNHYNFQDGVAQGYEVGISCGCCYYNIEVEDDPRFRIIEEIGLDKWMPIPSQKRTPEGLLIKGDTLLLDETLTSNSFIEIDLKALVCGQGRNGRLNLFSFETFYPGGTSKNIVYLQSYYGTVLVKIGTTDYSSSRGVFFALPNLGLDASGHDMGVFRFVFWNAPNSSSTCFLLYMNDILVDTIELPDIFSHTVSSITLYGSSFLRIKNYRIRKYGRITRNPQVSEMLTRDYNCGYLSSGDTLSRPSSPEIGFCYFDTTPSIEKPVFFSGTGWVDASGTTV